MMLKLLVATCCLWQVASRRAQGGGSELTHRSCVDVNSATIQQLKAVEGIGMSLAYRIVRARTCFLKDVEDLREKLRAQRHSEGLWAFDGTIAPKFEGDEPELCVGCEKNPDRAKSPWRQKVIDVNVASFSRLQRVEGIGESMASRILQARSCFFEDEENFRERFLARPGNTALWKFVKDLLEAGAICLSNGHEEQAEEQEDVLELSEGQSENKEEGVSNEQTVQATLQVQRVDPLLAEEAAEEEVVEQAVKKVVRDSIGHDFVSSQVECKVVQQQTVNINVNVNFAVTVTVTVPFQEQAESVQHELSSEHFSQSLSNSGVTADTAEVCLKPVMEPINHEGLREEFWRLMGQCGTTREDFDGFEHRPDWDVLPFTSKICQALGCYEAMAAFSDRHNRPCHETDNTCKEAQLWVSVLYRGSSDCRGLSMAEKMHEDLAPIEATCSIGFCKTACLQALRDFPGLARGCRAPGCAQAYAYVDAMYDKIAECKKPNAGSSFPLPQRQLELFQLGLDEECAVAPVTGGWAEGTEDFDYCSFFKAVSSGAQRGKFVDPRTDLCIGWLHKYGEPDVWQVAGKQGAALLPCDLEAPSTGETLQDGYIFHSVWQFKGEQGICVVVNAAPGAGQVTQYCIQPRTGPSEIVQKSASTRVTDVGGSSSPGTNFPVPLPPKTNLLRLRGKTRCIVVPPVEGWGLGSTDMDYCTYFKPVSVEDQPENRYKLKDPRSDLCFGWIHLDSFPGSWTIPGINGPAAAPCSSWMGDRIGQKMDFNTVFQWVEEKKKLCIVTNSHQITPYCFRAD